jgi:hypothetical protein
MELRTWMQMETLPARPISRTSYDANGSVLDAVYPVNGGVCDARGEWVQEESLYDATLKAAVHGAGQLYLPTIAIASGAAFEGVLDNSALSAMAISNLVTVATTRAHDGPWDGVDFDIEAVDDSYKNLLTAWYEDAVTALHDVGLLANITIKASYQDSGQPDSRHVYDIPALSEMSDTLTVMLYSSTGMDPNTAPGAYGFDQLVLDYMFRKGADVTKFYAGLGVTSRYVNGGTGTLVSYDYGQTVLADAGENTRWYELGNDGRRFSLHRATWDANEMWVANEDTVHIHLNLIEEYGLAGACLFVLGSEDPNVWTAISDWQTGFSRWHGYIALEKMSMISADWATLLSYAQAQGQTHKKQLSILTHWRMIDSNTVLVEADWGDGEIGVSHCDDWLGALLGIDVGSIGHANSSVTYDTLATPVTVFSYSGTDYIRLRILGGIGSTWEQSRTEALAYL